MTIKEIQEKAKRERKAIHFTVREELIQEDDESIPGYFECTVFEDGSVSIDHFVPDFGEPMEVSDFEDFSPDTEIEIE